MNDKLYKDAFSRLHTTVDEAEIARATGRRHRGITLVIAAALVLAGLAAEGITIVDDIKYIQRGYEQFDEKLRSLGGQIEMIRSEREARKFRLQAV